MKSEILSVIDSSSTHARTHTHTYQIHLHLHFNLHFDQLYLLIDGLAYNRKRKKKERQKKEETSSKFLCLFCVERESKHHLIHDMNSIIMGIQNRHTIHFNNQITLKCTHFFSSNVYLCVQRVIKKTKRFFCCYNYKKKNHHSECQNNTQY